MIKPPRRPADGPANVLRAKQQGGRSPELDVLRVLAVVLVLGRHMFGISELASSTPSRLLLGLWNRCGWIGVDLFFVLSGFLVSGLLFSEYQKSGEVRVGRFLMRRAFKIYPPFYVLLGVTVAFNLVVVTQRSLVAEALFFQNYVPGLWGHTWSLAVEEHFYILLAAAVFVLARRRRSARNPFESLPALFVVVTLTALTTRFVTALTVPHFWTRTLLPSHARIDSLFFGVVLSYCFHFRRDLIDRYLRYRQYVPAVVVLLLPVVFLPVETSVFMNTIGLVFLYLAFGAVTLGAIHSEIFAVASRTPIGRSIAFLGERSYSIYLWHLPAKLWFVGLVSKSLGITQSLPIALMEYIGGAFLLGVVMAFVVETPALALRDYLIPRERVRVSQPDALPIVVA
jgi:peptidoglycan/LPS O-acetylase OafA/YrhL